MGTVWVKEFTGGLDTRRLPETTQGGVLILARDGHITRGGEFDKRAAFVSTYTLPPGTHGLAADATSVVVFGHEPEPPMPAGVRYQRLQHPDGVALARILSVDNFAGRIYVAAEFADGSRHHFYDGVRVEDWYDGRGRASFRVVGGTGASQLLDLTVDGVNILAGVITWSVSHANTAQMIAASVNAALTAPDYVATAVDDTVNIIVAQPGAAANGRAVVFTLDNGFAVSPATGLTTVGGTDLVGDFQPGTFVKTSGARVLSVSGPLVHGSGLVQPTKWTTDTTGAFFIDMSTNATGSENLVALAEYQNLIAVFAERTIQTWFFDADPENNRKSQVLNNTGTGSPRSVTQFGDNDLFYLDESGVRSLRARDSSNAAATTDIGVPIDTIVSEKLSRLSETERLDVIGLIEPRDGRFWLIMGDEIFVFSYFPGAKVSAWSTYVPGFVVSDAIVFNRRAYVRSEDTIYVYGGLGVDRVYDDTVAEVWLPYMDAGVPTQDKQVSSLDIAARGSWQISLAMDVENQDAVEIVARVGGTTYGRHRIAVNHRCTHISPRFRTIGSGEARLGSVVLVFDNGGDEDK